MKNSFFKNASVLVKKYSPEILMGTGIAFSIASTVTACIGTIKIKPIIDDVKIRLSELEKSNIISEERRKEERRLYIYAAEEIAKCYSISAVCMCASITSILVSRNIMHKRNLALSAAYTALNQAFSEYRKRVAEKYGEEEEKKIRYNMEKNESEQNQNSKPISNKIGTDHSIFSRIFDETIDSWEKDPDLNKYFLIREEQYANDVLKAQGYLFLNDVYKRLGFDPTAIGAQVGWIYNPDDQIGDGYVDFGIFDITEANGKINEAKRRFVNGYERSVLLDFNVDGVILDRLEKAIQRAKQ